MKLDTFSKDSWDRYLQLTPDASIVHRLLGERGESIINDHVAYRTFNIKGIDRLTLGKFFEEWGYRKVNDELDFPEKKLKANYWLHPDASLPKIFISELLVEKFSKELQTWIQDFTSEALGKPINTATFLTPSWKPVSFDDYERFYGISEYASWTAAFGIQVNHFTVLVNRLKSFSTLQQLNEFLISHGLTLNSQGGIVKGTPEELLEQSSTQAKKIPWKFSDGESHSIMGCYYEFARRYPLPNKQELFQGFIPKSANRIFESNFEKK